MSNELKINRLLEIFQVLESSSSTELLKASTNALNEEFLINPSTIYLLVKVISQAPSVTSRQLASLELNKLVKKYWIDLDDNLKEETKQNLLELILHENEGKIRRTLAEAVSRIAEIEIPAQKWDLLPFIYRCCSMDSKVEHREVGLYLVNYLFDTIFDSHASELNTFFNVAKYFIKDPNSSVVRGLALDTINCFAEVIEPEHEDQVKGFQEIIPDLMFVLEQAVKGRSSEEVQKICIILETCMVTETPLLAIHFKDIFQFLITVVLEFSLPEDIRSPIINILSCSVSYTKTKVLRAGLVEQYIRAAVLTLTVSDSDDFEENNAASNSLYFLNIMSDSLPANVIFATLGPMIYEFTQHKEPLYVRAALSALEYTCFGCADYLKTKVTEVIPMVCQFLQSSHPSVRKTAVATLSSLAAALNDDIIGLHQNVVPQLLLLLEDPDQDISTHVWESIETFMEALGENSALYLPQVMEKGSVYINNLPTKQKISAINAIGITASASKESFVPYMQSFIERVKPFLESTNKDPLEIDLRASTLECISNIIIGVGKENTRPYMEYLMNNAFQGISLEGHSIKETSFNFFASVAEIFKEEISPFLPQIFKEITNTIKSDGEETAPNSTINLYADDDDEDDDDLDYHSGEIDEKEAAIKALTVIFKSCNKETMGYLELFTELLESNIGFDDPILRREVLSALLAFVSSAYEASKSEDWVPGIPVRVAVHPDVTKYIKRIMDRVVKVWNNEYDSQVVTSLLYDLDFAIQTVGPALIVDYIEPISQQIKLIFKNQAYCQTFVDDEQNCQPEDLAEQETLLLSYASDVLGSIAKVIGPDFKNMFNEFFPLLKKHNKPNLSENERAMITALYGDICIALKDQVTEFTGEFLETFFNGLQDPNVNVRSNSVYGIGVLCENTQSDITKHYNIIFQRISDCFHPVAKVTNIIDNACGAACRLISRNPQFCPINEVIPVVINHLPLKVDQQENTPIYTCLAQLIEQQNPVVAPHLERLKVLITQLLNNPHSTIKKELYARLSVIASQLHA